MKRIMQMPPSMVASPLQRIKFEADIEKYSFLDSKNKGSARC
jgi:hypothetical protein